MSPCIHHPRYFTLHNCVVRYYKDKPEGLEEGQHGTPAGEIRLDQLKKLTLAASRGGLGMKLQVGTRTYYLLADTEESLQMWIDAIDRSTVREGAGSLTSSLPLILGT